MNLWVEKINTRTPWWAKIGAKLILSRLPFGYAVWQRLGLFRHGNMDSSEYAINVFHNHIEKAGLNNKLKGITILELGPGDSIASAIIAAAYGAQAIIVDAGRFVREDITPYLELSSVLTDMEVIPPDLSGCTDIKEILNRCSAKYITEGLKSLQQINDNSVDLIFSQAVLEHIRENEFLETIKQFRRILKVDGICSHQVDLRDHLEGGLNNLRISKKVWESEFFAKSGFYTNRIQYNQMLNLFGEAGFEVNVTGVNRWRTLPIQRHKLAKEFKILTDEELCISTFDVLCQ